MADITIQNITKTFGDITALSDVSLTVKDGEFFVLLGPTGAGKTTTLRVIAGLEKQEQGSVLFDGKNVDQLDPADRDVAFVFQQYSLYPNMTVYDNLAFPLKSPLRKLPKDEIDRRIHDAVAKLHISHLLQRKTGRLSGGEMQRVSIGRAIVREPRVFLMDEPLSNLDAKLREGLRVELEHLQKVQHSTTLFVTHDQVEALTMADRIAVLNEGRIEQIGTPHDIYDRPATTFVATLVGSPRINLLKTNRHNGSLNVCDTTISLDTPANMALPEDFLLGIRPEDIQITNDGEFVGKIVLTEPLGVETIVHLNTGDHTLLSVLPGTRSLRLHEEVSFNVVRERLHYFDTETGSRISG